MLIAYPPLRSVIITDGGGQDKNALSSINTSGAHLALKKQISTKGGLERSKEKDLKQLSILPL